MSGKLFLVPTPIGNAADLSPRAREVLSSVDRIAAEDTRVARRLLATLEIRPPPLVSYHDHNEDARSRELLERLLTGERIALVSDAGTPLISDPGFRLLRAALEHGVEVVALPGPCAAVVALSASGLPTSEVLFLGFLPRDAGPRRAALERRREETATLVLYEAPHRVRDTLVALREVLGDRRAALARSLTKPHEEWSRATLSSMLDALGEEVTGEITLVVEGASGPAPHDAKVDRLVDGLVAAGVAVGVVRDVVAAVYDRPRRAIYQRALAARAARAEGSTAMIPPEPENDELKERLERLLALEVQRIIDDLSLREEWLVDTWNRHRDRGPFLDTLFSRYRGLTMTELALLDSGALLACEAFYRELEALRLYFRFTQDMPATLADRYRESLRRMRAYGTMALDALGGAPEQPVVSWPEGEEPPGDAGELLKTPQLEVVGSDEEETTDLDG